MNNNKLDETALQAQCKGVFSKTGYITVGTPEYGFSPVKKHEEKGPVILSEIGSSDYVVDRLPGCDPLLYKIVAKEQDETKAKPIYTQPAKLGRTPDTFFEKIHTFVAQDLPYVDRVKYAETQEKPGKGFLTSDYSKRDEFTSTIRTEQYRSLLKQEEKHARKALQHHTGNNTGATADARSNDLHPAQEEVFLFDLVYFDDLKGAQHMSSKLKKDTCNPTAMSPTRNFGTYRTATQLSYPPPQTPQPPQHGHRPVIETTFYRKSNVFLVA